MSELSICVVIAAFNAEATIARAVRSALESREVHQVIVVDDASNDATADAARAADDRSGRLLVLTLPANKGPAAARNRALDACTCTHFCVLDADDYLLPGRMERLLASGRGEWDMLADDLIILPEELAGLSFTLMRNATRDAPRIITLETFVFSNTRKPGRPRGELGFLKPLISIAFLNRHNLRYDEGLKLGEDYALYMRALIAGARFQLVSACGYIAIEGRNSLSSRHTAEDLRRYYEFEDQLLATESRLPADARAAIKRHRDSVWKESVFREALDVRHRSGLGPGIAVLMRSPSVLPHVIAATAKGKLRMAWQGFNRSLEERQRRLRFLVGFPGTQFQDIRSAVVPQQRVCQAD